MTEPRILLEGAREKPLEFFGETTLSVESLGGNPLVSISPVAIRGTISHLEPEYLIEAEVSFSGELDCGRCLETYAFEEKVPLRLRLRKRPSPPPARPEKSRGRAEPEEEVELEPEELDVVLYDQPVLPFDDIAREQVLMAIPMKPLCREECLGLCPACGKDRNMGDCGCERASVDPRLEVLKSLK